MTEEAQVRSIRDRINAFQLAGTTTHLGRAPITANVPNDTIPARPFLDQRSQSTISPPTLPLRSDHSGVGNEPNAPRRDGVLPPPTNVTRTGQDSRAQSQIRPAPPPRLPPRRQSTQPSPALPPRRPSDQLSRKASDESISSTISSMSSLPNGIVPTSASRRPSTDTNRVKAPPFNPTNLPSLPPKRSSDTQRPADLMHGKASTFRGLEQRKLPPLHSKKSSPSVITREIVPELVDPPKLPMRRQSELEQSELPARKPEAKPPPKLPRSALSFGMNKAKGNEPQHPATPPPQNDSTPPPIPHGSRPDLSKILATKPNAHSSASEPSACLLCRDFSIVDAHAAKLPRPQVPSLDWLAQQLTNPFPSPTDKARSIFTWLHHNISYDTVSFFAGNVKPSTPASTLQTGLAVCEGYAGLFTALASKVGLESVVVGGHGKGFGFASLPPGASVPAEDPSGHAWNAVKIDGGYWKLIDCCWGAGHISGTGQMYTKHFSPRMFTMPNVEFGLRHYPQNRSHFFVEADGKYPPRWQEYYLGPLGGQQALEVYGGVAESEGISETSFLPPQSRVAVSPPALAGPTTRFQFSKVCDHWDPIRNGHGPPYVFILAIKGVDGRQDDYVPFETNGHTWWLDIEPRKLGCAGQTISAYTVETVDGQSGRGLGIEGFKQAKGRKGMSFGGLAAWELV